MWLGVGSPSAAAANEGADIADPDSTAQSVKNERTRSPRLRDPSQDGLGRHRPYAMTRVVSEEGTQKAQGGLTVEYDGAIRAADSDRESVAEILRRPTRTAALTWKSSTSGQPPSTRPGPGDSFVS